MYTITQSVQHVISQPIQGDIEVTFIPSYDSQLAKAIEDDRLNYISSEKSYLLTNNSKK